MTPPSGDTDLPDPAKLNGYQIRGWSCALCNTRLIADRSIGTVEVRCGDVMETVELWACRPSCPS